MNIIGNKFLIDFGMAKATLYLQNHSTLTFNIIEKGGEKTNIEETVTTNLTELRPQLYLLTWKEKSGTTVTQVQDHEKGLVYNSWTQPNGDFAQAEGTLQPLA